MAIDSISGGGLSQFQTRGFQPGAQTETDNNAVKNFQQQQLEDTQFQISPNEAAQNDNARLSTTVIKAPEDNPANNDAGSSAGQSVKDFLDARGSQPGPADTGPNRGSAQSQQVSALNYNANGAANAQQNPTQAGRLVSLSV